MNATIRVPHGTIAWFEMVGAHMCEAAARAGLPAHFHVSLVERYTDGAELAAWLVQGLRFDIIGGQASFRVGARQHERADITIEITAAASRVLNTLNGADPKFHAALADFQRTGDMRVDGALAQLGAWFGAIHDPIVARTR